MLTAGRAHPLAHESGFGRACNVAAERGRGDYIALVSPDAVLQGGAIARLAALARGRPHGGIFGGRAVSPGGSLGIESCWA